MTSIPIVLANSGDITGYMPTNIMSITDGQWILDMNIFRDTMRPAVNTGLSVTRVGGVGQNDRQHKLLALIVKSLNGYAQAQQYAHFGSELTPDAQRDLERGKHLFEVYNQSPNDTYNVVEQCLMLDVVLNLAPNLILDVKKLKENVREAGAKVKDIADDKQFAAVIAELIKKCTSTVKGAAAAKPEAPAEAAKPDDGKDAKEAAKAEAKK
jgi:F-type H+-transporting ATPase subunit alpha